MSRENVDLVLGLYDAVERQDYESPIALLHEDVEWNMTGLGLPDVAEVFRGHDGVRRFWIRWLGAWETLEFAPVAEDLGEHVLVECSQTNRGRASGVTVDFHYFQSFTIRDGKVTAVHASQSRDEVLERLGLEGATG